MVSHRLILTLGLLIGSPLGSRGDSAQPPRSGPVPTALGRGSFPWYDTQADKIRVVKLPVPPDLTALDRLPKASAWRWGDYLVFGTFVVALVAVAVLMARSWKRFEPTEDSSTDQGRGGRGNPASEILPDALRLLGPTNDPWAEANRLRLAGNLAGAVLCLFAHQMLTVSRLGLVRLAPGRTGRQLHRSVLDAEFQRLMTPTLRQFEAVYYGHRDPSPIDFATLWEAAEAFERRAATAVTQ